MGAFKSLMASLGLDGSNYAKGMDTAEARVKRFSHKFKHAIGEGKQEMLDFFGEKAAGLVGIVAIEELVRRTMEYASAVDNASKRIGISTTAYQEQAFALKETGGSAEYLTTWYEKLAEAREKALGGTEEAEKMRATFRALGVNVSDLESKKTNEEITKMIGVKVKMSGMAMEDITPMMREIGGRGAGEMATAMQQGLDELAEEAQKLGQVMSQEDVKALHEAEESFKELGQSIMVLVAPAVSLGCKVLAQFTQVFTAWTKGISGQAKELWKATTNLFHGNIKESSRHAARFATGIGGTDAVAKYAAEVSARSKAKREAEARREAAQHAAHPAATIDHSQGRNENKAIALERSIAQMQEANALKGLSAAKKLEQMNERRLYLEKKINDIRAKRAGELDEAKDAAMRVQEDELTAELVKEQGEAQDAVNERYKSKGPDVNNLQRIGAYASAPSQHLELQKQANKYLSELPGIRGHLQRLGATTQQTGGEEMTF